MPCMSPPVLKRPDALQSGNVVFAAGKGKRAALEATIAAALADEMGAAVEVLVRPADEVRAVLAANPLAAEAKADPSHLLVMFLKDRIDKAVAGKLTALPTVGELVHPGKEEVYLYYPPPAGSAARSSPGRSSRRQFRRSGPRATGRP